MITINRCVFLSLSAAFILLVSAGAALASCESVHQSNLGVCRSEYQPQCNQATTYANQYCGKQNKSVEDRSKCTKYSKIRDEKCRAMNNCRRQAEAAFNTCKQQRAAGQTKKK